MIKMGNKRGGERSEVYSLLKVALILVTFIAEIFVF